MPFVLVKEAPYCVRRCRQERCNQRMRRGGKFCVACGKPVDDSDLLSLLTVILNFPFLLLEALSSRAK